jgi:hypothetical protein
MRLRSSVEWHESLLGEAMKVLDGKSLTS